jgi:hypothetical protein
MNGLGADKEKSAPESKKREWARILHGKGYTPKDPLFNLH